MVTSTDSAHPISLHAGQNGDAASAGFTLGRKYFQSPATRCLWQIDFVFTSIADSLRASRDGRAAVRFFHDYISNVSQFLPIAHYHSNG